MLGRRSRKGKKVLVAGTVGSAVAILLVVAATDARSGPDFTPTKVTPTKVTAAIGGAEHSFERHRASTWVSTPDRKNEALPCTGPKDPINFEIFSAGPAVAGLPLTSVVRRCDAGAPADEAPANYVAYLYGHCEIADGATGCALPLQIHTWPACQRSLADYSFEGKPLPYRRLPEHGGAEVVEINFSLDHRIEVYTKSSTVVIFASSSALAKRAIELLRSQSKGKPPVTDANELGEMPPTQLEPPSDEAMEGGLSCQS
jgi:hypothetical protein